MEELIIKTVRYFIEKPYKEVYLREYAKENKISVFAAKKYLDLFSKEGLVSEERKANLRYFKANISNPAFKNLKIAFTLHNIRKSGLIDEINEKVKGVKSVVLFGSAARGEDDENSDIDIVIIGNSSSPFVSDVWKKLGKQINEHVFKWSDWNKEKKKNFAFYNDVIVEGILLYGERPVVHGN